MEDPTEEMTCAQVLEAKRSPRRITLTSGITRARWAERAAENQGGHEHFTRTRELRARTSHASRDALYAPCVNVIMGRRPACICAFDGAGCSVS